MQRNDYIQRKKQLYNISYIEQEKLFEVVPRYKSFPNTKKQLRYEMYFARYILVGILKYEDNRVSRCKNKLVNTSIFKTMQSKKYVWLRHLHRYGNTQQHYTLQRNTMMNKLPDFTVYIYLYFVCKLSLNTGATIFIIHSLYVVSKM